MTLTVTVMTSLTWTRCLLLLAMMGMPRCPSCPNSGVLLTLVLILCDDGDISPLEADLTLRQRNG